MKTILAIAAIAMLSGAAGHAAAQDDGPMKVRVSYADLDLSRAGGRAMLEQRVSQAIERVCPERPLPTELDKQQDYRACHSRAWAGARQQLAAIYSGRQLAEASVRIAGVAH